MYSASCARRGGAHFVPRLPGRRPEGRIKEWGSGGVGSSALGAAFGQIMKKGIYLAFHYIGVGSEIISHIEQCIRIAPLPPAKFEKMEERIRTRVFDVFIAT